MEFVEKHIAGVQGQQRAPAAPVPPAQGADEIRTAVRETAEQIHGKNADMLGQSTQGIAGHLGEALRNMQTHSGQNMEGMYNIMHQNQAMASAHNQAMLQALANPALGAPGPPGRWTVAEEAATEEAAAEEARQRAGVAAAADRVAEDTSSASPRRGVIASGSARFPWRPLRLLGGIASG